MYDKLKVLDMEMMVLDAGYKTTAIAGELIKDGVEPLFPYKRPMTKEGFFKKYEYVYDEYYDCYICPADQILWTTNREGYREYKRDKNICKTCAYLSRCTESKEHEKQISKHIWKNFWKPVRISVIHWGIKQSMS